MFSLTLLIFLTLVILVALTYFRCGRIFNPVSFITSIWLSLLLISNFSLSGIYVASYKTQLVFLGAITFMVLGALLPIVRVRSVSNIRIEEKHNALVIILSIFSIPILIALFNAISIVYSQGYFTYLAQTRWGDSSANAAYGSQMLASIVTVISKPLAYASVFIGLAVYLHNGKKTILLISFLMMFSIAFLHSSRGQFLIYIVMIIFIMLLSVEEKVFRRSKAYKTFSRVGKILLLLFVVIIFIMSIARSGGQFELFSMIVKYTIGYYTFGFQLFDQALNNHNSLIHDNHFGLATFSFIDFINEQIHVIFLGDRELSLPRELRTEMSNFVVVGFDTNSGELMEANAFYTVLFPLYADFGYLGVFLLPALYGYILMRSYLSWKAKKDIYSLSFVLFFTWSGYNALTFPSLISEFWWFALLSIFLLLKVRV